MAKGRSMLGWMVGLMTGTALGMLFAPRKGKDIRDQIKKVREKGGMGYEPMVEDMKQLSKEMRAYAKDSYKGSPLPEIVQQWRGKLKGLADEFVDEVADFHDEKIVPMRRKTELAGKKAKTTVRNLKVAVSIGKRAAKEMKKAIKK